MKTVRIKNEIPLQRLNLGGRLFIKGDTYSFLSDEQAAHLVAYRGASVFEYCEPKGKAPFVNHEAKGGLDPEATGEGEGTKEGGVDGQLVDDENGENIDDDTNPEDDLQI